MGKCDPRRLPAPARSPYVPATGGRAVAAALNETAAAALTGGRVLLSRRLADPAMLAVVEAAAERLRFDVTVA